MASKIPQPKRAVIISVSPSPASTKISECPCRSIIEQQSRSQDSSTGTTKIKNFKNSSVSSQRNSSAAAPGQLLCCSCTASYLQEARQRRARVLTEHNRLRDQCRQVLESSPPWAELQQKLRDLHTQSKHLRASSDQLALATARQSCENDARKAVLAERHTMVLQQRTWLQRWHASLVEGALQHSVLQARAQVRRVRFRWAVAAFAMHRLVVDPQDVLPAQQQLSSRTKHARGIGKIGGLPLPHAGPELYGVLPPTELTSALRLVASLTSLVATCLGIRLPHPMLLTSPREPIGDLANFGSNNDRGSGNNLTSLPDPRQLNSATKTVPAKTKRASSESHSSLSSSTASLASYVGQTATRLLSRATASATESKHPQKLHSAAAATSTPSTSSSASPHVKPISPQQRIHHARSAVLAEHQGSVDCAKYSLALPHQHSNSSSSSSSEEEFAIALQLLQNNIVALCIRAGAPVSQLWPAEAVLLNLHVLCQFCQEQAKGAQSTAVSAPSAAG